MKYEKRQSDDHQPPVPWSIQEQQIEDSLSQALSSEVPHGLTDRVMSASAPMLPNAMEDTQLDAMLVVATKVEVPFGLSDRIMAASLPHLQGNSQVIGRVGFIEAVQPFALAACIVFAVLVAIRMEIGSAPRDATQVAHQGNKVLSVEEEGYLLEDLQLGEYAYLADTRELDFAEIATELNGLRRDLELWQYGLLTE